MNLTLAPESDKGKESSKKKSTILSFDELAKRCEEVSAYQYLINELIPARSLGLLVGHSGLGKSALLYQMAVCVASGKDFLGHKVDKGRVLVMDYENGIGQVKNMVESISKYLGLEVVPKELRLWNYNDSDSSSTFELKEEILKLKPALVIIDSITGMYPDIEERNNNTLKAFQELRVLSKTCGTSILGIHHLRKPSNDKHYSPPSLEQGTIREWFYQVRGAGALINNSDVRIGIDESQQQGMSFPGIQTTDEIALVMRGFGRVKGEIPLTHIARVYDDEGEPLGYKKVSGSMLLFNPEQEEKFNKLPNDFRFKEAKQVYGKGDQATTDFLKKCINVGILKKHGKGRYVKASSEPIEVSGQSYGLTTT
jgi:hypothetical protein